MCSKSEGEVFVVGFVLLRLFLQGRNMVTLDHKQTCNGSDRDRVLGSLSTY